MILPGEQRGRVRGAVRTTGRPCDGTVRCAIYTRSSVGAESGLKHFSAEAQRGVAEALLLSFAQFERGIIADRIRDKVCASFRHGRWAIGAAPLGYRLRRGTPRLIPDAREAELVRTIFELYLECHSTTRVAAELNAGGYHTRYRVSAKGNAHGANSFAPDSVSLILRNVIYIGRVKCNGTAYPGEHEPIVDEELWHQAQVILDRNADGATRYLKNQHGVLLKHLLYCRTCGAAMQLRALDGTRGLLYYRCVATGQALGAKCPASWVRARELDAAVLKHVRSRAAALSGGAPKLLQARGETIRRVAELERHRRELNEELQRIEKASARLPDLALSPRAKGLRARLVASHRELVEERNLARALLVFSREWDSLGPLERWHALGTLAERVLWDPTARRVTLFYRGSRVQALCGLSSEFVIGLSCQRSSTAGKG